MMHYLEILEILEYNELRVVDDVTPPTLLQEGSFSIHGQFPRITQLGASMQSMH